MPATQWLWASTLFSQAPRNSSTTWLLAHRRGSKGEAVQRYSHDDCVLVHAEGSFCLKPFNVVDSRPQSKQN